jgi:hypothetical protein
VTRSPTRTGQVITPIHPRALNGLTPDEIVDRVAPVIIDAARRQGGHPSGTPELLTEAELRARIDDPRLARAIDAMPGKLWVIVDMVPAAEAAAIAAEANPGAALEVVAPPVRLPRHRRPRR